MNHNDLVLTKSDVEGVSVAGVMMFATQTIDGKAKRLMVERFHDDGVDVVTPDGNRYFLERFLIVPPIAVCLACGKAMELKEHRKHGEYAICPDHARHMYESYFAASHNVKQFNHAARRQLQGMAKHWLHIWQHEYERRVANAEQAIKKETV